MKISKLFHWLYALVMLLPIFAIGVTCGYAMFNKNAYHSYYGETINEELRVQVEASDTINNVDTYYLDTANLDYDYSTDFYCSIYVENLEIVENGTLASDEITKFNDNDIVRLLFTNNDHNYRQIEVYKVNPNNASGSWLMAINLSQRYCILKFNINNITIPSQYTFNNNWLYTIEYNKNSFVSEVFYYSVDRVKEAPIFSWAYNSFLAVPIVYITSLFSIPSTHLVVELLSYWLAISIIWLVFDLIMYVPLLVHRWLDKGVLE